MVQATAPQQLPESPFLPPGPEPLVFTGYVGLNTNATRTGIKDEELFWCDGWMPIGPNYLRTLPDVGAAVKQNTSASVVCFGFANIGTAPYLFDLHDTGRIEAFNTDTGALSTVVPDGTVTSPSVGHIDLSQWGSQYALFIIDQTDGYFVWDGTLTYSAGTLAPAPSIVNGGTGYTVAPTVSVTGGSGSGASIASTVTGGSVTGLSIIAAGTGYVAGDLVTLGFSGGGGSGASATAVIMPFGISGTAIETYTSRAWIGSVARIQYTSPGSPIDVDTANGSGSFVSNDSFLRVGFSSLKQSNGFLYLVADSSINYISGVQTGGTPLVTTFTNQNADPEIGTPWPATVDVFSRNIVFANAFGAHVSYGGAVTKISDNLDGIYPSVPLSAFGSFVPSAAKAIIYGKRVWMFLYPIIDPITGARVNKLFMWNGKVWWSSSQSVPLTFIAHQEINSIITAYGTDGKGIYPLFQTPSTLFTKTVQSKLWDKPGRMATLKAVGRLWGAAQFYLTDSAVINVTIDNENGSPPTSTQLSAQTMIWTNDAGDVMPWINNNGDTMIWLRPGLAVFDPKAVGQNGVWLGMTATTNAADVALVSIEADDQVADSRY